MSSFGEETNYLAELRRRGVRDQSFRRGPIHDAQEHDRGRLRVQHRSRAQRGREDPRDGDRKVADMIKGKMPEEITKTFGIANDFTPEEEEEEVLLRLLLAANYLDVRELLDATCQTVADMIKGNTPEEIRKTFKIANDFTPEEEEEVRKENAWAFES
ncbi:hypothetical protein RHGRI_027404 [Rhododendron griersonianum]|uniref:SKP1 component dimerisation domain-containing protein n=1 Tax=Rhododendron griersonianum TaxID=479676 RepID=A0AAV6IWI6_9ERIC|nr:hypothetical protein RHGRI_027404 [Rhododendron griersonianum]